MLALFAAFILPVTAMAQGPTQLKNGAFAPGDDGSPAGWTVGKGQKVTVDAKEAPPGLGQSLRVDVITDGGSSYGQVYQTVKAKPGSLYRLEGKMKSTKAGLGLFSIKLLKGGSEIKRIGSAKSPANWATVTQDFSSEDADEIQALCRWEQNAQRGWVGQTCWFADLKLMEMGTAPAPPAWTDAIKRAAAIKPVAPPALPLKAAPGDLYILPSGAGKNDGSNWDNALPGNAPGVFQAAWDALASGQACRIGSGVYANVALTISTGGTAADKMKRLAGEDTGAGLPWFIGDWQPKTPDKGASFLSLTKEVDYCAFENLQLARYQYAMFSKQGRHTGLRVRNMDAYEMRHGIFMAGFANADEPDVATHDFIIQDCDFIHFTKSGIRLQAGHYDVKIINCVADAGGTEWMKESFQICFNISGDSPRLQSRKDEKPWAPEHDIIFVNCVARNAIWSKARYWQGDGFIAQGGAKNIAFINCSSYDNADGGWDVKAENVVYVNCVGMRSKKNFRAWRHGFFFNCLSAYAFKRGGSWTSSGLWSLGDVRAANCTFHDNESQGICADAKKGTQDPAATEDTDAVHPSAEAHIILERCLVSCDGASSNAEQLYSGEQRITKVDSAEWRAKTAKEPAAGIDPEYVAAASSKAWMGQPPEAFDSKRYGAAKGYNSTISAVWRAKSPEQLIEAARTLLKHSGWDDFKKKAQQAFSS